MTKCHGNREPTTTTGRVLQLLGLLQSRRVWSGEELADRLGVTSRSVRRDVERLRDLGYPVHASKGHGGGYQLGAGAALPPLLLDPDEAVAMAVCLRLAAGGSVAGVGESALRALSKLDQVMPSRLRSQVSAVHDATTTLTYGQFDALVEPDVLMTLARATRDREHVSARYVDRDGNSTERRLEPYQLVTTGRRWYLLCYDRDRDDWRSLRLDRMADVMARGTTFLAREAPDAASYVRRAITASPYRYVARVRYQASKDVVAQSFSDASAEIEADGPHACIVTAGADEAERMVPWLAMPGVEFEVLEPPEVIVAVRAVAERLIRAARQPPRAPTAPSTLALDVGGSKIAVGIVDSQGNLLHRAQLPTPRGDAQAIWAVAEKLLADAVAAADGPVRGVGIGSAGPIHLPSGTISPINIAAWQGFPIVERVAAVTSLPVRLGGDGLCMAMGERWHGAGRGARFMLGMVVSTGIGGGLVLDGTPYDGRTGNAGHVGHVVVEPDGVLCTCGGHGCVETVAAGPHLVRWARESGWTAPLEAGAEELAHAATAGDAVALRAFGRGATALARMIASVAAVCDLDLVVIGGGVAKSGALLFDPLREALTHYAGLDFIRDLCVVPAELGGDAGLVGAAALFNA